MPKLPRWIIVILTIFIGSLIAWRIFQKWQSGRVVTGFIQDPGVNLQQGDSRTQIALMGIGGEGHEGGDLTDSIIVYSYSHKDNRGVMIPLPRDIWVPSMAAKLNTAYHYGSLPLAKTAITEVIGLPIHYVVILDFAGFERMIDAVGGIDVVVAHTFDDYKYPIPGLETAEPESSRYEHLHFDAGLTHMDGNLALKFARSRHSEGDEGTDFARSARQELVVNAFKDKLLSTRTLLNLSTLSALRQSLSSSLITDLSDQEFGSLIRLFINATSQSTIVRTLDLTNQFINPQNTSLYQNQWVLVPITSFTDLAKYVQDNL